MQKLGKWGGDASVCAFHKGLEIVKKHAKWLTHTSKHCSVQKILSYYQQTCLNIEKNIFSEQDNPIKKWLKQLQGATSTTETSTKIVIVTQPKKYFEQTKLPMTPCM